MEVEGKRDGRKRREREERHQKQEYTLPGHIPSDLPPLTRPHLLTALSAMHLSMG